MKVIKKSKQEDTSWLDGPARVIKKKAVKKTVEDKVAAARKFLAAHGGINAGLEEPAVRSTAKLKDETKRFGVMVKQLVGKSRVWATDGEYVAFRRKLSNPATLQRHNQFVALGNYQHVTTQDDVEVYQLLEGSPFKRGAMNLNELRLSDVRRQAIIAACKQDWGLFVDILSELSSRLKGLRMGDHQATEEFARQIYEAHLTHIFGMIEQRRGPTRAMIDAGVQSVRRGRGEGSKTILIPA